MTAKLPGGCHCGNLTLTFETALEPRALPLRACQCSFCLRHGAVSTSDPQGRLRVEVARPDALVRYRFGLGITDFLICGACGVYVAAVMPSGGGLLGVVNVNAFDDRRPFARSPEPMVYGAEAVQDREARRARAWMPVELRLGATP